MIRAAGEIIEAIAEAIGGVVAAREVPVEEAPARTRVAGSAGP
jgi:hypothetical protein